MLAGWVGGKNGSCSFYNVFFFLLFSCNASTYTDRSRREGDMVQTWLNFPTRFVLDQLQTTTDH